MMTLIALPHPPGTFGETGRRLVFYLAMEEYVAAHRERLVGPKGEALFLWQVPPTVIFGRNQVMEAEVNVAYCREKGIRMFRRKSGGGCVYADMGNVMVSYVTGGTDVEETFGRYLDLLSGALRGLGLDAVKSAHNDVLVDGRKVSGNAYFLLPKGSIVHGTLLYDVDFGEMERAITPSAEKLGKHGVASVHQRVMNLREVLPIGVEALKRRLVETFCDAEVVLGPADIAEIEAIEADYLRPAFIAGK